MEGSGEYPGAALEAGQLKATRQESWRGHKAGTLRALRGQSCSFVLQHHQFADGVSEDPSVPAHTTRGWAIYASSFPLTLPGTLMSVSLFQQERFNGPKSQERRQFGHSDGSKPFVS